MTDTRPVEVKGRTVAMRRLKDGQLLILGRDAKRLGNPKITTEEKLEIASGVLDILESAVVDLDDRDYVLGLMRTGEVDVDEFISYLTAPDAAVEIAKPVVRRGRPRKSIK